MILSQWGFLGIRTLCLFFVSLATPRKYANYASMRTGIANFALASVRPLFTFLVSPKSSDTQKVKNPRTSEFESM
jgi:hypothetical protein